MRLENIAKQTKQRNWPRSLEDPPADLHGFASPHHAAQPVAHRHALLADVEVAPAERDVVLGRELREAIEVDAAVALDGAADRGGEPVGLVGVWWPGGGPPLFGNLRLFAIETPTDGGGPPFVGGSGGGT